MEIHFAAERVGQSIIRNSFLGFVGDDCGDVPKDSAQPKVLMNPNCVQRLREHTRSGYSCKTETKT